MRVTRQSQNELVLVDSGLWLAAILAIAAIPLLCVAVVKSKPANVFAGGLFLLSAFLCSRKSTFTFDREHKVVRWRVLRYFGATAGVIPFEQINNVGIETAWSTQRATNYRLTLLTGRGGTPMNAFYGPGKQKYAVLRDQILQFLELETSAKRSFDSTRRLRKG